jgi:hypothetical protein
VSFEKALKEHNEIKVRLILFMNGSGHLNAEEIASPEQCALGQWLMKAQKQLPHCDIIANLIDLHKAFHFSAVEVISLLEQGLREEAHEFVQPDGQLTRLASLITEGMAAVKRKHNIAA